jgi:hypothetical protein
MGRKPNMAPPSTKYQVETFTLTPTLSQWEREQLCPVRLSPSFGPKAEDTLEGGEGG